jgi:tetratricopeptide (TPR) repeat protein
METAEASLFSGWILTSIGAQLWSPSGVVESADLFYRAHLVDPGNETALVGLAAAYEKSGDYPKAIEYLSQAVVRNPQDLEVRLRLAMCQLRLGEPQKRLEGQSSLIVLTGEGGPDWIRSLAFQELARAHIDEGKEKLAEERLRRGLAVLAGDQQLTLLLARIVDGRRNRDEALSLLAAMDTDGWQQESPRERYDVWRPPGVEEARRRHLVGAQQGLVALETGLMAKPGQAEAR